MNDQGIPAPVLSDVKTFSVTVTEVNRPPVLAQINDQSVDELVELVVPVTATDPDLPANLLTVSFAGPVPPGLFYDGISRVIRWTPTEMQGPTNVAVTVQVADNGFPPLSAARTFNIVVQDVNSPPVLPLQTNRTIPELKLLSVTNTATNSGFPTNAVVYTPLAAPTGAVVNTQGVIISTPSEIQGPSTNRFVTVATDNGDPPLSTTNAFTVFLDEVNSTPQLAVIPEQRLR